MGAGGCGKPRAETPAELLRRQTRLAYSLMDQGDSASALILLEDLDRQHPGVGEIQTLLASAYLGKAGIDVYQIHDRFKDILFDKPLSETFWKAPTAPKPSFESSGLVPSGGDVQRALRDAPVKRLVSVTDAFLIQLQQYVVLLNRFPAVPSEKWPLLETALARLDHVAAPAAGPAAPGGDPADLRLYRIFVRTVYLKAFFDERFLNDVRFGTREWACAFEWSELKANVLWAEGHLHRIGEDFQAVFPQRDAPLARLERELVSFARELDQPMDAPSTAVATELAPRRTSVADLGLRSTVREVFRCE